MSSQHHHDASSFFIIRICPCNFTFVREGGANAVFAYRGGARGRTAFPDRSCARCEANRCQDPIPFLRRFLKSECGMTVPSFLSNQSTCTATNSAVSPFVVRVSKQPFVPLSSVLDEHISLSSEGFSLSSFTVKDEERHRQHVKEGEGQGAEAYVEEVLRPYLGARVGPLVFSTEGIKITFAAEIVLSHFQSSISRCCCCCTHVHRSSSSNANGASEKALLCSFSLLPNYAAPVSVLAQPKSLQEKFPEHQRVQQLPSPHHIHVSFELKPKRVWCPPSEAIPAALQAALKSAVMDMDADTSRCRAHNSGAVLREDGTENTGDTCKEGSATNGICAAATTTPIPLFVHQLSQRILQGCYSDGTQYVHPIKARRCRFSQMATHREVKRCSENKNDSFSTVDDGNKKKKDISKKHRWDLVPTIDEECFSSSSSSSTGRTSTAKVLSHCTEAYLSHLRKSLSFSLAAGGETGRDRPSLTYCPSLILPLEKKSCWEVSSTSALNASTNVKGKQACPHCEETLVMSCSGDAPRPSTVALGALLANPRNNLAVLGHSFTEINSTPRAVCSSSHDTMATSEDSIDQSKKQLAESATYKGKQERLVELLSFVEAVLESDVSRLFTSLSKLQCAGLEVGALGGARDILARSSLLEQSALEGNGDARTELECGGLSPSEAKRFLSALEDRFYTAVTASDVSVMLSVEMREGECSEEGSESSGWFCPKESASASSRGRVTSACGDWFLTGQPHEGCGFLVEGYRATQPDENSRSSHKRGSEFLNMESTRSLTSPSTIFTMIIAVIDIDCKRTKPISYYASQDQLIVSSCVAGDVRR